METLTERNLDLEEKVRELRETVGDLVRRAPLERGLLLGGSRCSLRARRGAGPAGCLAPGAARQRWQGSGDPLCRRCPRCCCRAAHPAALQNVPWAPRGAPRAALARRAAA